MILPTRSSDNSNTGTNGEAAKTTTGVHLRSGKGTNYSSLGVIPGGTAITVTDKSDVWCSDRKRQKRLHVQRIHQADQHG